MSVNNFTADSISISSSAFKHICTVISSVSSLYFFTSASSFKHTHIVTNSALSLYSLNVTSAASWLNDVFAFTHSQALSFNSIVKHSADLTSALECSFCLYCSKRIAENSEHIYEIVKNWHCNHCTTLRKSCNFIS